MKVEPRKRSHRRADEDHRVERLFVCRVAGLTSPSPPSGTLMRGSGKRVGLRMDDTSGKFALVMLRTKQVRVHHKRTKHEYVFRISDDRIEVAECLLHPNHAAPVDPRDFREEAQAAAEWFVEKTFPGFHECPGRPAQVRLGGSVAWTSVSPRGKAPATSCRWPARPGRVANRAHVGIISAKSQ